MDDQYDPGRLRYGKVILLTDADSDGHHIATLLLTFFYRHVPGLFTDGRVFLACPPLYKITWGKETHWASDDRASGPRPRQASPEREAEHHPVQGAGRDARASCSSRRRSTRARRRLLRVVVPDDDRPYTDRTVSDLMGKEPEARFKFIMEEAYTAKDIDI